jgi:hypothetical protein
VEGVASEGALGESRPYDILALQNGTFASKVALYQLPLLDGQLQAAKA